MRIQPCIYCGLFIRTQWKIVIFFITISQLLWTIISKKRSEANHTLRILVNLEDFKTKLGQNIKNHFYLNILSNNSTYKLLHERWRKIYKKANYSWSLNPLINNLFPFSLFLYMSLSIFQINLLRHIKNKYEPYFVFKPIYWYFTLYHKSPITKYSSKDYFIGCGGY